MFEALSRQPEVDLTVYYWERAAPDSPWPEKAFRPFERLLKGRPITIFGSRFHFVWGAGSLDDYDVIILNGYMSLISQWILRRHRRAKLIFWAEQMHPPAKGLRTLFRRVMQAPLKNLDALVAIGKRARVAYSERFPGKPVFNIPYMCELSEFSRVAGRRPGAEWSGEATNRQGDELVNRRVGESQDKAHINSVVSLDSARDTSGPAEPSSSCPLPSALRPSSPPTLLFCGQMIHRKGIDVLLDAFEQIVSEGLEGELRLVGREADLPDLLAKLSPETRARVHYDGFKAPEELPEVFGDADVFVLPSRYDGWGVVVNQALGAGLPVISTEAVGAAVDLVQDGVNGRVVPPGDVDALADALRYYLTDPERIITERDHSLRLAEDITPAAGARKWVQVLQSVTKQ